MNSYNPIIILRLNEPRSKKKISRSECFQVHRAYYCLKDRPGVLPVDRPGVLPIFEGMSKLGMTDGMRWNVLNVDSELNDRAT